MNKTSGWFCTLFLAFILNSCGLVGIHLKLHNPSKAGAYPAFSEKLLAIAEPSQKRDCFDVTWYHLDIQINPTERALSGEVEIKGIATGALDTIQIDLAEALTVKKVVFEGDNTAVPFVRKASCFLVKVPEKLAHAPSFTVKVAYEGAPQVSKRPPWAGGMVWKKDKNGKPWVGVACETEGGSLWFPCKDANYDEPDSVLAQFSIADTGVMIVSNGQLVGEEHTAGRYSSTWKVSYPINVYDITFYVGDFRKISDEYRSKVTGKTLSLDFYVLPGNVYRATDHYAQTKPIIAAYELLYGPYPWYRDGFKLVESPYAGMEHQTAIAIGTSYKKEIEGKVSYIILHETGHEWFGNSVTAADLADVWLQEGFTTYGESLYLEKDMTNSAADKQLLMYRLFIKNKYPMVGPYGRKYFDYHDGDVYTKGAWLLKTLRTQINDDATFFKLLRTWYAENAYHLVRSEDFIEMVGQITGKDYNWLFDQYLHRNDVPVLEYNFTKDHTLLYRWTHTGENFDQLNVRCTADKWSHSKVIAPSPKVQSIRFAADEGNDIRFNDRDMLFGVKHNRKLQ